MAVPAVPAVPLPPAPPGGPYPASYPGAAGFSHVLPATIGATWPSAGGLQVHLEDCLPAPSARVTPLESPRGVGSPPRSARRGRSQEVAYVQRVGDPSHFKAVGPEATKRLGRGGQRTPAPEERRRSSAGAAPAAPAALSLAEVAAAAQAEVLAARDAEGDHEIFELSVATERSRLLYRMLAALLQGVLLGLLLASLVMEMELTDLLNTSSADRPLAPLRGLVLAIVECCLAMNILRASEGYEHGLGSRLSEEEESFGRRRAWAAVANAAVLGVMNIAVLLCCLLGEMLDGVQSTLLQVSTGFSIIAIWPALLDLLQVTSQLLPSHVLLALLKASKSGE